MVKLSRNNFSGIWLRSHEKLSDFYASSWQAGDSPVPLLVVRLILAVLAVTILVWTVLWQPTRFWFIFLTNWGLVLVVAMTLNGLFVSVMAAYNHLPDSTNSTDHSMTSLPWYVSTHWFLYNVSVSIALLITALFWILLFSPVMLDNSLSFAFNVATHAMNSVIVLAELAASRMPVYLVHVYQPLGVALWYATFSAVYFLVGGTDTLGNPFIYEILDWAYPDEACVVVGASLAGLLLIYFGIYGVTWARDRTSATLIRTSYNLTQTPANLTRTAGIV